MGHCPLRIRAAVLSAAIATVIAGCGQQTAAPDTHKRTTHAASIQSTQATFPTSAHIPDTFDPIDQLAGDRTDGGVWFWSDNGDEARIFNLNPQGDLNSWKVLSGADYQPRMARAGLAVGPSGLVWLGINLTLISLNPRSGSVRHWTVPKPRDNPTGESHLPPAPFKLRGEHAIQALAVGPLDAVSITMSNSSSVEIFDYRTETFKDVDLPSIYDQPVSVAYDDDGLLAVRFSDLKQGGSAQDVLLASPNGNIKTVKLNRAGSAWELTSIDDSTFAAGSIAPDLITAASTVTPLALPAPLTGSAAAPTPLAVMPDGRLAGVMRGAVLVFSRDPADSSGPREILMPETKCAELPPAVGADPPPSPTSTASVTTCPRAVIGDLTVDHDGNLWIAGPSGRTIDRLTF